ncbi:hypothetical protein ETB97_002221 [Aspergillus alliaceus]|uniref:Cytochrome P450 n=1 Tax=Petromyces alliaceus TaxID=209559 RepID=A0A8H6E572_PETAA|nr:hypothetical protein ETB97_002221 [Aspergillus burnettii]
MTSQLLWIGILAAASYLLGRTIYRLYFHPLSKFPGPKLAAVTHLYEFYFDAVKSGKYLWEIGRMHEKYGPIVRINPRELHIKDPYFFDSIYNSKRQGKDPYMVRVFTVPRATVATIDHDHHRFRRELLNSFFSKRSVMSLEYIIQDKVDKVAGRLMRAHEKGAIVSLDELFAALTADIISHYTYGESMGILDSEDLQNDLREAANTAGEICHFSRFSSITQVLLDNASWFMELIEPTSKGLFDARRMLEHKFMLAQNTENRKDAGPTKTIFDTLCDKTLPPEERTIERVRDEALLVLGAGTETTGRVLTVGSFHLYRDRSRLQKLREELKQVMLEPTSKIPLARLEQLPYLTAVINESLRMAHSVTIRLPRVPTTPLAYKDYTIPPGTPVSQSIYFVHTDPSVFPDPETFNPERWIEASSNGERLTRFLVPFTKGPRICLGMNLAYSELYLMFAALVRRFELEIKTTPESIRITRDMVIGLPESGPFTVHGVVNDIVLG